MFRAGWTNFTRVRWVVDPKKTGKVGLAMNGDWTKQLAKKKSGAPTFSKST
jgi:hypothetical protein